MNAGACMMFCRLVSKAGGLFLPRCGSACGAIFTLYFVRQSLPRFRAPEPQRDFQENGGTPLRSRHDIERVRTAVQFLEPLSRIGESYPHPPCFDARP